MFGHKGEVPHDGFGYEINCYYFYSVVLNLKFRPIQKKYGFPEVKERNDETVETHVS